MNNFDIEKYNSALSRGLCSGIGSPYVQMCIESAVCYALGLPHKDKPECVSSAVRAFIMRLNDSNWTSSASRAAGLRDLGIAQLGSKGVVDNIQFAKRVSELTARELIPELFREAFLNDADCLAVVSRCETEGTTEAIRAVANTATRMASVYSGAVAYAAEAAAKAAGNAAFAVYYADRAKELYCWADSAVDAADYAASVAYDAGRAAAATADNSKSSVFDFDKYLVKSAQLALRVLRELGSPGCELL